MTSDALTTRDVVPIGIAVLGWLVAHALSLRAQRLQFQHSTLDAARREITPRIRDYQNWLSEVGAWVRMLGVMKVAVEHGFPVDYTAKVNELAAFNGRKTDQRAWSIALEDYEILFPDTSRARARLDRRGLRITFGLEPVFKQLLSGAIKPLTPGDFDNLVATATTVLPEIDDLSALLEDLRIHLQNGTLSETMGRAIPERAPTVAALPRLKLLKDGKLEVVNANNEPLDKDEIPLPGGGAIKT